MTRFADCLEKRLLRKDTPNRQKALIALEISEQRLMDAEISMDSEIYSATILLRRDRECCWSVRPAGERSPIFIF